MSSSGRHASRARKCDPLRRTSRRGPLSVPAKCVHRRYSLYMGLAKRNQPWIRARLLVLPRLLLVVSIQGPRRLRRVGFSRLCRIEPARLTRLSPLE